MEDQRVGTCCNPLDMGNYIFILLLTPWIVSAGLRSIQTTFSQRRQAWLPTLRFWKQLISGRSRKWALMKMIDIQQLGFTNPSLLWQATVSHLKS
jgi:hypothetical protein